MFDNKKKIYIFGCTALGVLAILVIYFTLVFTGAVELNTNKIIITSESAEKYYDGDELICNEWEITNGKLKSGHKVSLEFLNKPTEIGEYENSFISFVYDENDNDITSKYDITHVYGNLIIKPIQLVIKTPTASKVYDGLPLSNSSYEFVSGEISPSHTYLVHMETEITYVGRVDNDITINIFDADNVDVTRLYDVTYQIGTLEITKRSISIQTLSLSSVFNGIDLVQSGYIFDESSLATTDSITIKTLGSIRDVGVAENDVTYLIKNNEGITVNDQYSIEVVLGELEVLPVEFTVITEGLTQDFNAEECINSNYTITKYNTDLSIFDIIVLNTGKQLLVGTSDNTTNLSIKYKDIDVSKNCIIDYELGILEVKAITLNISAQNKTKQYDGEELINKDITISGNISNAEIEIVQWASIIEPGLVDNSMTFRITLNGIEYTDQYIIVKELGRLSITRIDLYIESESVEKTYDGIEIIADLSKHKVANMYYYNYVSSLNHTIDLSNSSNIINVGTINNVFEVQIYDENNINVTEYYYINTEYGTFTINPMTLIFETISTTKTYDGVEVTPSMNILDSQRREYTLSSNYMLSGNFNNKLMLNAGTYNYESKHTILTSSGDYTNNFDVSYEEATVIIEKIYLNIKSNDIDKIYDGELLDLNVEYDKSLLVLGDTISIEFDNKNLIDAYSGTKENKFTVSITRNGTSNNDNYEIEDNFGTIEIDFFELVVSTANYTTVYDGQEHKGVYNDGSIYKLSKSIPTADTFSATLVKEDFVDVISEYNYLEFSIKNSKDEHVTNNYKITLDYGKVVISQRSLTIKAESHQSVYDGQEVEFSYNIVGDGVVDGDELFVKLKYESYTDVISAVNEITSVSIFKKDTDISSYNNYKISYETNTIDITQRGLTIKPVSYTGGYNGQEVEFTYTISGDGIVDGIVDGVDELFVELAYESYTNVISAVNEIVSISIFKKGTDISSYNNYNITLETSTITITKRELIIQTDSYDGVYNGQEVIVSYSVLNDGIVNGDELFVVLKRDSFTDVISYENVVESIYIFKEGTNISSSDNYNIRIETNTINITPAPLKIITNSYSKFYDGEKFDDSVLEIEVVNGLASSDSIDFSTISFIDTEVNAGSYDNKLKSFDIMHINGNKVNSNYDITVEYGTLTINKISVQVTSYSNTPVLKEPNKILQYKKGHYTLSSVADAIQFSLTDSEEFIELGLINCMLKLSDFASTYEVGIVSNSFVAEILGDGKDNYQLVQNNYGELSIISNTSTVSVILTPTKTEAVYEGDTIYPLQSVVGFEYYERQGYSISVDVEGSLNDVGESVSYINEDSLVVSYSNDQELTTFIDFEFTFKTGQIIGYQYSATIGTTIKDVSKVYDGTALTNNNGSIQGLEAGHKANLIVNGSQTNVGTSANTYSLTILDVNNNDITNKYLIINNLGTLTVTRSLIEIELKNIMSTDDVILSNLNPDEWFEITNLSELQTLFNNNLEINVTSETMQIGLGQTEIVVSVDVFLDGVNVTNNFSQDINRAYITVIQK